MMFSWLDYVRAIATTEEIAPRYRQLRIVQLAQAIVESGRGTSQLFQEAGNPAGLKWQDNIDDDYSEKITEKVWLVTPSETSGCDWCQWKTAEQAVRGYWRFIDRPNSPYEGWEEYGEHPEGYLQYIWEKGYATDPNYVSKVKGVFPEAQSLLEEYSEEQPQQTTFTIAIMPGHGGRDSGAINNALNLREKDYNWKEAVEIQTRLEAEGNYRVIICREENELASLSTLQQRANDSGADICLCLHHNACNKKARGWWLFYVKQDSQGEKFVKVMDKHFRQLPLKARGYEYAGKPFAHDWYKRVWNCIRYCQMPTILFESCFIDNNDDARWLRDGGYQQIVEKICAGVQDYLGDEKKSREKTRKSLFVNDPNPPLNVRSGPGASYDIVGRLDNGTALSVIGDEGNWLKISKPVQGYVHQDLTKSSYRVFVNDPNSPLNVRSGPGTNFEVVAEVINGTALTVVGTDGDWLLINQPVEGYVFASFTSSLYRVFVADYNPPLNVRSGPGSNFEKVSQLDNNTALTVVDSCFDSQGKVWLRISNPCSGWVLERLTSDLPIASENHPASSRMSESEQHDYYRNIITSNGGSLKKRNLISFRKETSTKVNNWKGCYDDITVMIWKDSEGKHVCQYHSNTEPSSQYEDSSDPRANRSTMGVDANDDRRRDLGRLPEGYYEYQIGTSSKFSNPNVLIPTKSAMAERDTDHSGTFEADEPRASAGRTMLFHQGGTTNTYSAGCQTMNPNEYEKFWHDLNSDGNPGVIGYTIVRWC
ncbi:MAG: SH3 domain-containing protein [Xenococcus sp. (in: cyanobacteria)]|nr:SH3 domain-containing protein [Xenococcaceae cyanobacterium MO_167.B52]